ncbi:phenylalanyl-tRNA synthetase [Theileria orientalis]|uniref:Phenylalanyl-tRNA synthetase n=1 Tax=Theileria orientalis TaxID=68886 RepID=A0A976MEF9_THEOR|nr:phenylalanyl-tRNA synthetase [Theileria orientalis]
MSNKQEELNLLLTKLDLAFEKKEKDEKSEDKTVISTLDVEFEHDKVVSGVKSLMSKGYVTLEEHKANFYFLTEEGELYAKQGSPEYLLVEYVKSNIDVSLDTAVNNVVNGSIGLKKAMKDKYLTLDKDKKLSLGSNHLEYDVTKSMLLNILTYGKNESEMLSELNKMFENSKKMEGELSDLKKRKLFTTKSAVYYNLRRTNEYKSSVGFQITDLTTELLETGKWQEAEFKKYNFFSSGKRVNGGDLHPLVHSMYEFRRILTSMGFQELDTSRYLESSFWCFDAMYIPQQHPARDTQDTFFLRDPERVDVKFLDPNHVEDVRAAHGNAAKFNSTGWQYEWSLEESMRTVLRTHVTPCTARKLKQIAEDHQKGIPIQPCRYFAIDKVFRNEATDSTHLCEFHQVEGFVVGFDLGLADLIGIMETFYGAIGINPLKFKPAYNPYTEPSMEIFGFHKLLNTWIEVGNSGIFRPEMLLPMGLPENLTVIAWGLSLERPTMVNSNIRNIRDLIGCKY